MKTIKIIDLYNIITEGKKPPKKIKYDGFIYTWGEDEYSPGFNLFQGVTNEICLTDEVEIIEDEPNTKNKDNLIFYLTESINALERLLQVQKGDPIIVIKNLYDNTKYDKKINKAFYHGKKQAYKEILKRMKRE